MSSKSFILQDPEKRDRAQQLIDALRSGDYGQEKGVLKSGNNCYCLLGLACEVSHLGDGWDGSEFLFMGERFYSYLPLAVVDYYGFYAKSWWNNNPCLVINEKLYNFTYANDTMGLSFEELANYLEQTYLG